MGYALVDASRGESGVHRKPLESCSDLTIAASCKYFGTLSHGDDQNRKYVLWHEALWNPRSRAVGLHHQNVTDI